MTKLYSPTSALKRLSLLIFLLLCGFQSFGQEICDNGIDDDGDNLVDVFDPDCPCDDQTLLCQPSCEFSTPGGALNFQSQWVSEDAVPIYQTPLVADIDNDGVPNIVIMSGSSLVASDPRRARDLVIINGATGQTEGAINTPFMAWVGPNPVAIADVDDDGFGEIIIATIDHPSNGVGQRRYLFCYEHTGTLKWQSDVQYGYPGTARFGSSLGIADFNNDGVPEVYVYNQIFNALTGRKLAEGGPTASMAVMTRQAFGDLANPIAADLTSDPGLELACGNTVFQVNITNPNGTAGNSMTPIVLPGFGDGYTSLADIDLDGNLDVVVASEGSTGRLYVWNPGNGTPALIASINLPNTGGNWVGVPFVGDMDKDCQPEIGVTRAQRVYALEYDGTTTLQNKWTLTTTDGSGFTGITMFDFNQDGTQELVYRDESTLRIIDGSGSAPVTIGTNPCASGTGADMPVVADVDGDGQAEICVTCETANISLGTVNVFGATGQAWAPCRQIWNQYSYFNVNINTNLSVPIQQQQHQVLISNVTCPFATCSENRPFNSFLAQSTFLTQDGCPVYPAINLSLSIVNSACDGSDVYNLGLNVSSTGGPADPGYPIRFYAGNPFTGAAIPISPIGGPIQTNTQILPGGNELIPVQLDIAPLPKPFTLFAVLNDDGSQTTPLTFPISTLPECDFTDNFVSIAAIDCCPFGDLAISGFSPANPEFCLGSSAPVTVNASSSAGLSSAVYTWTAPDNTTQTGNPATLNQGGTYSVVVRDNAQCTASATVPATAIPLPTAASAGTDQSICEENTTLSGNNPNVGTGAWSLVSGTGVIANPAQANTAVSGIAVGISRFAWTITNGGQCVSSDTVNVTRISPPDAANAGPDIQVCGTSTSLAGSAPVIGSGLWTVVSGSGIFDNNEHPSSDVSGLSVGANVFQWTVSNGVCPPSTDQVTVTRFAPPGPANAGVDLTICSENGNLNAQLPAVGTGAWTLSSGTGTIANTASNTSAVSGLSVGANVFTWTVSNGNCPPVSDQVTITRLALPSTSVAGTPQQICADNTILGANAPLIGTGTWSVVSGSGSFASSNTANTAVNNLAPGANVFQWTITNGSCPPSSAQVTITRDEPPSIAVVGADQQICADNASISANTPIVGTGAWNVVSGSGSISASGSSSTTVSNLIPGTNSFAWTISNGVCPPSSDTLTILVDEQVGTPDAGVDQSICAASTNLAALTPTVGSGTWSIVSGSGVFANAGSPNTAVSNVGVGLNVYRWTVTNGTCEESDEVSVLRSEPPSAANAGPDQTICAATALLDANTPLNGTGIWSIAQGAANFGNTANPDDQVSGLQTGVNLLVWTISSGSCTPSIDTVAITVSANPVTPDAGPDQDVCADNTNLAALPATVGTGAWTVVSGGGTLADAANPTTGVSGLSPGINTFRWTVTSGACVAFDQVNITRSLPPDAANAGADTTICSGSTLVLQANNPTVGTGAWVIISGNGSLSSNALSNAIFTAGAAGTTVLEWTISSGSCPASSDQISITVSPSPSPANAGADQALCSDSTSLNAIAPLNGTGLWAIVSGSGTIDDPNTPNSAITGLTPGQTILSWTVSTPGCVPLSDQVVLNISTPPTVANAGPDAQICGDTLSLSGNPALTGTGQWTLITGSGIFANATQANTLVSNVGFGVNVYQWTISSGSCPPSTDQIVVIRDSAAVVANAGPDLSFCEGALVNLQATSAFPGSGNWTIASGTGSFADANDPTSAVSGLSTGTNTFVWTVTTGTCPQTSDTVSVTISPEPSSADAGADTAICGTTLDLQATVPLVGTGVWSVATGSGSFNNTALPNATASALSPGTNILVWTVSNGACPPSVDSVFVEVSKNPIAPNAGVDQNICADSTNLSASTPNVGIGVWSILSGVATLSDSSSTNTSLTGVATGTTILQWTITNGPCVVSDQVIITRDEEPTVALAGPDQSLCDSSATLAANTPLTGSGTWTILNGGGVLSDPADPSTTISNLPAGITTLRWTISNGSCTASFDDVVLTRDSLPETANAGLDTEVCSDTVSLSAAALVNASGSWTLVSGSGIVQNPDSANTLVTGLGFGVNVFRWTVSPNGSCPETSDEVSITRNTPPDSANAGDDFFTCDNSVNLSANLPSVGTGTWIVIGGNAQITDPSSPNTTVSNLDVGNNVFEWRISNGVCLTESDQITISRGDTAFAGNDIVVCGTDTALNALVPTTGVGFWTVISGSATLADSSNANTAVSGLSEGENIFQWTVLGGACPDSTDLVTITFACNQPPVLVNDSLSTPEDSVLTGSFINGEQDPDGTTLLVDTLPQFGPSNGSIVIQTDGSFTYTPNENFYGTDTVIVQICDQGIPLPPLCGLDTLIITITPVNDPPTANNQSYTTSPGDTLTGNLLDNDFDVDSTALSADSVLVEPNGGSFNLNADGSFSYIPNPGFSGIDTVVVLICDSGFPLPPECVSDTIYITVNDTLNDPPVITNDSLSTNEDTPLSGNLITNDFDPDGTTLIADTTAASGPQNGSITINPDGSFVYTPNENFNGVDTVVITICDQGIPLPPLCGLDTLVITVLPVNDPPVTESQTYLLTQLDTILGNLLSNDFDPDSTALSADSVLVGPSNGTFNLNADGSFSYIPNIGFVGLDTVVVLVCDSGFPLPPECVNDTLYFTVNDSINDPPVLITDTLTTNEDESISGNVLGDGNFDPEGTTLTADTTPISGPQNGSIVINPDGSFVYTPNENFNGIDTILINICDDGLPLPPECATDTLIITVLPVNDPPVIVNDTYSIAPGLTLEGNFLENDFDPDSTQLLADSILVPPSNGTFVLGENGNFSYTPNDGFVGTDTVVVLVCDTGDPLPEICAPDTIIIVVEMPQFEVDAGEDQSICATLTELQGSAVPPNGSGLWTQINGSGTIADSSASNTTVSGISAGANTFVWSVTVSGITQSDTVNINVTLPGTPAFAGEDQSVCGNTTELLGNLPSTGVGIWSLALGQGELSNPNQPSTAVSGLSTGSNSFVWTITDGPCVSSDTVLVLSFEPIALVIPADTSICEQNLPVSVAMSGIPEGSEVAWTTISGNATVENPQGPQVGFTGLSIGTNTFVVNVLNGACAATDTLNLTILPSDSSTCEEPEIFIPEGFSPNADGIHDLFVIVNPEGKRIRLEVYNRWGNLVYQSDDYLSTWDGTASQGTILAGEQLPESTYYYLITIEGESAPRKGYLTLWR